LRARRGRFELFCNFGQHPVRLRCDGDLLAIATDDETGLRDGHVVLAPLSGALIS
jgi:hypothetical protein